MADPEWITASPVGQSGAYVLAHNSSVGSGDQYEETARYTGFLFSTYEKSVHDPRVSIDLWVDTNQMEYDLNAPEMVSLIACMRCSIDPFVPNHDEIVGQLHIDVTSVAGDLVLFNGQSVFVTGSFVYMSFLVEDSSCLIEHEFFVPEFEAEADLIACENQYLRAWDEARWAASQGLLGDVSEGDVDEAWDDDPHCPDWHNPSPETTKKCKYLRSLKVDAASDKQTRAIAACEDEHSYWDGVKKRAVVAVAAGAACAVAQSGCAAQTKVGWLRGVARWSGSVAVFAVGSCVGVVWGAYEFEESHLDCLEKAYQGHRAAIEKANREYSACLVDG